MRSNFALLTVLVRAPLALCGELIAETGVLIADGNARGVDLSGRRSDAAGSTANES